MVFHFEMDIAFTLVPFQLVSTIWKREICQTNDSNSKLKFRVSMMLQLQPFGCVRIIHGQAKKIIWGSNSQGTTQKICRPPSAAGKFFRQPCRPRVQNDQNFFNHGIPMVYSQGSFISTFLPGLTTQGSFLRFFLIFSEFSWFFPIFHEFLPKNLPAAFGGQKFFPPLGSWPLPKFFYP